MIFQSADAFADRRQIGQRSAEPALIDIKLSARHRRFLDRFLRLFLAANEQNLAAAPRHFLEKLGRALQLLYRLIQIDDVDLVSLLENVRASSSGSSAWSGDQNARLLPVAQALIQSVSAIGKINAPADGRADGEDAVRLPEGKRNVMSSEVEMSL